MAVFDKDTTGDQVVEQYGSAAKDKTILITGTSKAGIGAETAYSLARAQPAHILLLARSEGKVTPVIDRIKEIDPRVKTTFISVELDDFDSVRNAANTINNNVDKIDIMINNAGIMAVKEFTTNKNGVENQFATNHLGHFLLTALLANKIAAAGKDARIVNVSSNGYQIGPMRLDDYNFQDGKEYNPWSAYGQSKTANILFSLELASRGITSFSLHPGVIWGTSLGAHLDEELFAALGETAAKNTGKEFKLEEAKTIQQGCATTVTAALDPTILDKSGSYLTDSNVQSVLEYASSHENAQKLWALSEELVGEKFDI